MNKQNKEGWILKQNKLMKFWKKRWLALNEMNLSYYDKKGGKEHGSINLSTATEVSLAPDCNKNHAFRIVTPNRTFYFSAISSQEATEWVDAIHDSLETVVLASNSNSLENSSAEIKFTLEDFEEISFLGFGSLGKIKSARFKDGKSYVLKFVQKTRIKSVERIPEKLSKWNLLKADHPFLIRAYDPIQTPEKIILVLDFISGDHLAGHLREYESISEDQTRLYAAELLLALGYLHSLGFILYHFSAFSILIDTDGHIKISLNPFKEDLFITNDIQPDEYSSPEYVKQEKDSYSMAMDWWNFGILIYEMLTGLPPFYDENKEENCKTIINNEVEFPSNIPLSPEAKDLIFKLLIKNPQERLGAGPTDFEEIKAHKFFESLDWKKVLEKEYIPEWKPQIIEHNDFEIDQEFTYDIPIHFQWILKESLLDKIDKQKE